MKIATQQDFTNEARPRTRPHPHVSEVTLHCVYIMFEHLLLFARKVTSQQVNCDFTPNSIYNDIKNVYINRSPIHSALSEYNYLFTRCLIHTGPLVFLKMRKNTPRLHTISRQKVLSALLTETVGRLGKWKWKTQRCLISAHPVHAAHSDGFLQRIRRSRTCLTGLNWVA